jgi:hypothetical protein
MMSRPVRRFANSQLMARSGQTERHLWVIETITRDLVPDFFSDELESNAKEKFDGERDEPMRLAEWFQVSLREFLDPNIERYETNEVIYWATAGVDWAVIRAVLDEMRMFDPVLDVDPPGGS